MTKFQITDIQRRDVTGRFLGMAADITIECRDTDLEHLSVLVRKAIGGAGYPSFSYEAVNAAQS